MPYHIDDRPTLTSMPETSSVMEHPASPISATASGFEKRTAAGSKPRSCEVCRLRKVRCDKESPCSNCRRAGISCVLSSPDRRPRWARRLSSKAKPDTEELAAAQVMERVQNLENLVQKLRAQLEMSIDVPISTIPSGGKGSTEITSQHRSADFENENQKDFGRLVSQDTNRGFYVSSGFWSQIKDELEGLKEESQALELVDSESSEDESSAEKSQSTQDVKCSFSKHHGFLFQHNLCHSSPDIREFRPLHSQIPVLLDAMFKNVNSFVPVVHFSTIAIMVHDVTTLTPDKEALLFSIYFAAIVSMDEDDVQSTFHSSKADLCLKFRLGMEYSLAKTGFLDNPNLVVVQALSIFLCLVRRHESPRFVWMMTGLVIRMGQALGLHRDGTHFKQLTPYEVEMRRRTWWVLCMMDMRASEDQGTDCMVTSDSFDTRLPLNINDADIGPETTRIPEEREGITDMTILNVWIEMGMIAKQMMTKSTREKSATNLDEQSSLLNSLYQKLDRGYLQYATEPGNPLYWVAVNITRLVMAKMTLLVYLPVLFSPSNEQISKQARMKLLVAAIEVAEYNHALNAERSCRQWRWVFQTYTHWYAIVYLLIEIPKYPWSPMIERGWTALHSEWLIPAQSSLKKDLKAWIPLQKLMTKARRYRASQLERLKGHKEAAKELLVDDKMFPIPTSPGPFTAGFDAVELFRVRWSRIVGLLNGDLPDTDNTGFSTVERSCLSIFPTSDGDLNEPAESACRSVRDNVRELILASNNSPDVQILMTPKDFEEPREPPTRQLYNAIPTAPVFWSMNSWLWADADPSVEVFANMDVEVDTNTPDAYSEVDSDMDWYNWIESTIGIDSQFVSN